MTLTVGSLFSGGGGLDIAVCEAFGGEVAWHCEVDPAAVKVLAHHWPTVRNLGDITKVDWAAVPRVHVMCGGLLPTPTVGNATGTNERRGGARGDEMLLPGVAVAAARGELTDPVLPTPVAHPSGNTPENHLRKKPGRKVVTDLAILVENDLIKSGGLLPTPSAADGNGGGRYNCGHQSTLPGTVRDLAHAGPDYARAGRPNSGGDDLATAVDRAARGRGTDWGKYAPAIDRWTRSLGRSAPAPTEPNSNGKPRLAARFAEWMMGWPDGWVTDPAIGISRNDQLRIIGNGVCPQQSANALRWLIAVVAESLGAASCGGQDTSRLEVVDG